MYRKIVNHVNEPLNESDLLSVVTETRVTRVVSNEGSSRDMKE